MHFFYNSPVWNLNSETLARIELIIYITTNGITIEKTCKHTWENILLFFLNGRSEQYFEKKQHVKKRPNMSSNSISNFFDAKEPFKNDDL